MPRAPQTPPSAKHASTARPDTKGAQGRVRAKGRRAAKSEAHSDIQPGVRVRVVDGPFSGKVGIVQGLDEKGGARVMLGLLVVRFALRHLVPEAEKRARPVLGTSHRKPVLARS